jgi:hypothetical protein
MNLKKQMLKDEIKKKHEFKKKKKKQPWTNLPNLV